MIVQHESEFPVIVVFLLLVSTLGLAAIKVRADVRSARALERIAWASERHK